MSMPEPDALLAGVAIVCVVGAVLALLLGVNGRTIAMAVAVAVGVETLYPGGTTGLMIDALRPLGLFMQSERDRTAARGAAVDEAADGHATGTSR
jgi:hypothetical protein